MSRQFFFRPAVVAAAIGLAAALMVTTGSVNAQTGFDPERFGILWPNTDFEKHSVDFSEVFSGGVPRDGIPPIYDPMTGSIDDLVGIMGPTEPVITVAIDGEARAYPLGILMRHEIVNDELAGVPIAVTFCPLCNASVVFDRRVGDVVLDLGVSGMLRNSDLIMWDHQTESWWQQFLGEAIVGEMLGTQLTMLPVRVESFENFIERYPEGSVNLGSEGFGGFNSVYLQTAYVGYDQSDVAAEDQARPFLFFGDLPETSAPLAYVVAVDDEAWMIDAFKAALETDDAGELIPQEVSFEHDDLVITWNLGQNAVMGSRVIRQGSDIGNVIVQRRDGDELVDAVHDVTFAFAFNAFHPNGVIYAEIPESSGAAGLSKQLVISAAAAILLLVGFMAFRMFRKRAA